MEGKQLPLTDPTFVSSISMTNYKAFLKITWKVFNLPLPDPTFVSSISLPTGSAD